MKISTLSLLACPSCHGNLILEEFHDPKKLETGSLTCSTCKKIFPTQHGIPHFIKEEDLIGLNRPFSRMYDWFSWVYTAFCKIGFLFLGTTDTHARREIISRIDPRGKVLEVSIGPGVNLPFLLNSPEVSEVFGLDISMGQLNRCKALLRRKGWSVDLFRGNAEELPFKDNSFDSVFHIGGINFFSNKRKAMEEMIRVAKPGTRLIICDENESGAQWYEKFLPGFKAAFKGHREEITAPVDLVPATMLDVKLDDIWNHFMYCLEFRKPFIDN